MRFASLGSGSEGNGLVIEALEGASITRVLLDCGFGLKEVERRLARLGLSASDLSAIVVTHEHSDHLSGVFRLARRYQLPVWTTWGTVSATDVAEFADVEVQYCLPDSVFTVGALEIRPFAVPHDAREPVQYVFGDGRHRLGVLTDTGRSTPHIVASLNGCDALVMECNHDLALLAASSYPYSLKSRISGPLGHLANETAAEIVAQLDRSRLQHVVAAHLSQQNNTRELACAALAAALNWRAADIRVAMQDEGLDWLSL